MRFLSEPEAWREIAERVDRMTEGEGYLCDQVRYLSGVLDLYNPHGKQLRVRQPVAVRMLARVEKHLAGAWSAYDYDVLLLCSDREHKYRKARVMAALWLALEAEAEAKAIRRAA